MVSDVCQLSPWGIVCSRGLSQRQAAWGVGGATPAACWQCQLWGRQTAPFRSPCWTPLPCLAGRPVPRVNGECVWGGRGLQMAPALSRKLVFLPLYRLGLMLGVGAHCLFLGWHRG